jgi:RNA recognition motif-containing protein
LADDDDDEMGSKKLSVTVQSTIAWHAPPLLPERKDNPPSQNNSKEIAAQTIRMRSVVQAVYLSEFNVPINPAPLSDVEQALDMTSHSSVASQPIPFFVPQTPAAPAPAPQSISTPSTAYTSSQVQQNAGTASAETVQSLGLPSFLVGQNLQALQTLASTPKLLGSFVDSNGMYDQVRLMNLVQTLSQNSPESSQQNQGSNAGFQQASIGQNVPMSGTYGQNTGNGSMYGTSSDMNKYGGQNAYGSNNWQANGMKSGGYRGAQNSSEGNLHLSGYGPGTTQSEIIALFSPYVQVSEVVVKATFSFVNTNDPIGAKQAREALNGALLGGTPVRINMAQRKNRDANQGFGASNAGSHYGRNTGTMPPNTEFSGMNSAGFGQSQVPPPPVGLPPGQGDGDPSQVRDDRGNPATKNLFVAGYGQGTTENHLRELFSQHTQIVGIISKGTFSFINTTDKAAAVRAREVLSGTMFNGGVLRINFAKETGRLGTSFDLTYGGAGGAQNRSHYGRSY